jgi:PD-(D/E)XK nuclease superfamily
MKGGCVVVIAKLKELLKDAHEKINKEEARKEELKVGTLRAGSAGAVVGDSYLYTQCGRLAQARLLGYQSEPTQEMRLMFNGGLTLEDYFETRLKAADIVYGKEEPVQVELEPGIIVSGRPDFDIILELPEGRRALGIEIKSLASPFSVIKQRKNDFPFMKHMLQAATYMTMLRRDEWAILIGHSFYVNQNGKKHDPQLKMYVLKFENDKFLVENEVGRRKELPFDKSHILAYYREVKEKTAGKVLMQRPTELELNVDTYNRCNYCPMASACNEYEAGQLTFEQWLERVKITKETE